MKFWQLIFFLPLFLVGCQAPEPQKAPWKEMDGRNNFGTKEPIYRARTPDHWKEVAVPYENENTILPIAEYRVNPEISLTVHTFPQPIPPYAQIERWKRQFQTTTPHTTLVKPQAHGGFAGLRFEAEGIVKDQPTMVIAWAMQIAPQHRIALSRRNSYQTEQMLADYTIKVAGPPKAVRSYRQEIEAFARSFELIREIPHDD